MLRVGEGYDVHKLVSNRELILGGVKIDYDKGLLGHSDADCLIHSIMDALLGSLSLGDIGKYFPDSDIKYLNISSMELLKEVNEILKKNGLIRINNIDSTIVCEEPKIAPYIDEMKKNISSVLNINVNQISIKATTEEKLGFTGNKEGIKVKSICLVEV